MLLASYLRAFITNLASFDNIHNFSQSHLLTAIGQLSSEDVPDQHAIGVHIHHHVVLRGGTHGLLWVQYILRGTDIHVCCQVQSVHSDITE